MKDLIIQLFGSYTPLLDESGKVIQGIAGVDFEWLVGVVSFLILIICLCKCFGRLLND